MKRVVSAVVIVLLALTGVAQAQVKCVSVSPFGVIQKAAVTSYTIRQEDNCNVVVFLATSAVSISLPAPGTGGGFIRGFSTTIFMQGSGSATITPQAPILNGVALAAPTINGVSSLSLASGSAAFIVFGGDGNWWAVP